MTDYPVYLGQTPLFTSIQLSSGAYVQMLGETKTVTLTLTGQSLAFCDSWVGDWVTEPGDFILVGSSSRDIRRQGQFTWMDEATVPNIIDADPR